MGQSLKAVAQAKRQGYQVCCGQNSGKGHLAQREICPVTAPLIRYPTLSPAAAMVTNNGANVSGVLAMQLEKLKDLPKGNHTSVQVSSCSNPV